MAAKKAPKINVADEQAWARRTTRGMTPKEIQGVRDTARARADQDRRDAAERARAAAKKKIVPMPVSRKK